MSVSDFLKQLELDSWYKVLIIIGGITLVTSFFVPVQGISSTQLQLLAGGVLLIGLGEWKNHKVERRVAPLAPWSDATALFTRVYHRVDLVGLLLIVVGALLLAMGLISIIRQFPFSNLWNPKPSP